MREGSSRYNALAYPAVSDLRRKSLRGSVVAVCGQGAKLVLQTATMVLLARLLSVEDFGLQGMAVALTSFLGLFREAGLGTATIQCLEVTQDQTSTLFWINVVVGAILAASAVALAPVLVAFYGDPRLYWVAVVSGVPFVLSGVAAQHQALLQRGMRFVTQAKIEVVSLAGSSAVGIVTAFLGWRYWSLVCMAVASSMLSAAGVWIAVPWIPGLPRRAKGIRPMLHFGWMASWNNLIVFLAWNSEKILLGRFWGADALGLYGRAYQLVTLPVLQLTTAITGVAVPALARIQHDAERLSRSFLKGYSLLVSLTVPITVSSALFAVEIVRVVLGAKWAEAAPIFMLLAPATLVFALVNPFSWLLLATGQAGRALRISGAVTPVVIVGIVLGLSYGPKGVALGYSMAMSLVVVPIVAWSKRGTGITWADLWRAAWRPLLSGLLAGGTGLIVKSTLGGTLAPTPLMLLGLGVVLGTYAWVLLIATGQKGLYVDLSREVIRRTRHNKEGHSATSEPTGIPRKPFSTGWLRRGFFESWLGGPYLLLNRWIWQHLPAFLISWRLFRAYGIHLHGVIQRRASRWQRLGTFFFRNRPELELLIRLLDQRRQGGTVDVAVLGCSKGAEVYSMSFAIRSARPDLSIRFSALDIAKDVLEFAKEGVYSFIGSNGSHAPRPGVLAQGGDVVATNTSRDQNRSIFERMSLAEIDAMFDRQEDLLKIKPRFREGITWHLGDAGDPHLVDALRLQDIVVANRFLCHMSPREAERCLRNLARLVKPGGYLLVSGIDLPVRTMVARELGWTPVTELINEIHEGDPSLRNDWPLQYWGLEPFDQDRIDWKLQYASVFQIGGGPRSYGETGLPYREVSEGASRVGRPSPSA